MNTSNIFTIFITFLFSCAHHSTARQRSFQQEAIGFTLDLIHRDSPLSPLYDPSRSRLDLINDAIHRSKSRLSSIKKSSSSSSADDIESPLFSIPGEYIMEIAIGTPPFKTLGIADTGSDLTWTQCLPCTHCYKQTTPIFNPTNSKSFKTLPCNSTQCSALGPDQSCSKDNKCEYTMVYGDLSYSQGDLSSDTFSFNSSSSPHPIPLENIAFGCGHDNDDLMFNETVSGIVGLGGGPLSIVNQLNVHGKFSYCLVPVFSSLNVTSLIQFGSRGIVEGPGTVSTPLVKKYPDTFYYLTLEAIKVANKSLNYKAYESSKKDVVGEGNIIIDSGTTLTYLAQDFYDDLENEVKVKIGAEWTTEGDFRLCYKDKPDIKYPTITVSFTGADIDLPGSSTFLEVEKGLFCFTFVPDDSDFPIFGNLSQQNLLVGYDLVKNQVSFKVTDCTKQ